MGEFVNYKKRSVELPPGCKDLMDVLLKTSKRKTTGVVFQRKCVAISPKTVATDRSQLRSTQKLFPPTQTELPVTEKRCERRENSSRGPTGVVFQRKCVANSPKTVPTDRSQLRITQKLFPPTQTELPVTEKRCERREHSSRGPTGVVFQRKCAAIGPKTVATDRS